MGRNTRISVAERAIDRMADALKASVDGFARDCVLATLWEFHMKKKISLDELLLHLKDIYGMSIPRGQAAIYASHALGRVEKMRISTIQEEENHGSNNED